LLGKHKVEPIELDMDETNYVPKNNLVSDEDVEFSDALDDIKKSLPKITEITTELWDAKSKQQLLKDPNLVRALHEEIQMDRFDKVQGRLEIEKTFGRYKGKSDLEAYIDLVTKMYPVNDDFNNTNVPANNKPNTPNKNIPDKSKAAPTKATKATTGANITAKDLFSMSDEDFNKLSIKDLV
jgi:hypothetical protein